jgi:hypothetical protein
MKLLPKRDNLLRFLFDNIVLHLACDQSVHKSAPRTFASTVGSQAATVQALLSNTSVCICNTINRKMQALNRMMH